MKKRVYFISICIILLFANCGKINKKDKKEIKESVEQMNTDTIDSKLIFESAENFFSSDTLLDDSF